MSILNAPAQSPSVAARLAMGGVAFATSTTAALAAPTTVTLETPFVMDGTVTTTTPNAYVFNIFSGINGNSDSDKPEGINAPGSFIIGSAGSLDDPDSGKPAFLPILMGYTNDDVENGPVFQTLISTASEGPFTNGLATGETFDFSLFAEGTAGSQTLAGLPYILDGAESYNAWLEGGGGQAFVPFAIMSCECGDEFTMGYLEIAYDAPSVSLALLSYGYETFTDPEAPASITTPEAFTPYTPPEDFVMAPIPEPATAGALAALVAGSTALLRRRRQTVAA